MPVEQKIFQPSTIDQLSFDLPVKLVEAESKSPVYQRWQVSSVRVKTSNQIFSRDVNWDNLNGKGNTYYFGQAEDGHGHLRLRLRCDSSNPVPNGDIYISEIEGCILPTDKWQPVCQWKSN